MNTGGIALRWMPQNAFDNKWTWLGTVQQQAIICAIVDPIFYRHMAFSLGHSELIANCVMIIVVSKICINSENSDF